MGGGPSQTATVRPSTCSCRSRSSGVSSRHQFTVCCKLRNEMHTEVVPVPHSHSRSHPPMSRFRCPMRRRRALSIHEVIEQPSQPHTSCSFLIKTAFSFLLTYQGTYTVHPRTPLVGERSGNSCGHAGASGPRERVIGRQGTQQSVPCEKPRDRSTSRCVSAV